MRILRATDYKRMPWKNGGGETVEIAVFPPGASVEDFGWRISMATVASDGPFSIFPDTDRTLSILRGSGMALEIEGKPAVFLDRTSDPLPFAADVPVMARLADGPITDLNVMTRRGRFSHAVERPDASADGEIIVRQGSLALIMATGPAHVGYGGQTATLEAGDAVVADAADGSVAARYRTAAALYLIRLDPVSASGAV